MLELVQCFPPDEIENAFHGVLSEGLVAVGSIEEADENCGLADDEHRYAPNVVRLGVAGVFVADGGERATGLHLGEDRVRIDSAPAQNSSQ